MSAAGTARLPSGASTAPSHRTLIGVGVPLIVGVVHVAVVARWYAVGSFDDDAGYILGAQAFAAGHGLTAHLANGTVVAGSAPPGYAALLAPLVAAFPDTWVPLRLLSVLAYAATFPLLWMWLRRREVGDLVRVGALALLALDPVGVTYGSMVMAEAPFVAVLLVLLLALDARRTAVVVVCAVALVWLKEAAIAIDVGVVLWLWWRREWGKGSAVAAGVGASLLPVVVARVLAGVPLAGSRYSQELGSYYSGGVIGRVLHVFPAALHLYLSVALPASVVPRGAPLWLVGSGEELLKVLSWQVSVLTVVGFVVWVRRRRDVTVVAVPLYLVETLLWPYVNERRVILVLPVVLAWYALGVLAVGTALVRGAGALRVPVAVSLTSLAAAVVGVPLVAQFPRDYLFNVSQSSSRPQGSRYMGLLAAATGSTGVIETDYPSTTALFAGHRSADGAYLADNPLASVLHCAPPAADAAAMRADGAGWLLTGDLNKADLTDNPCILASATTQPWAVRLLRTSLDAGSVFELIGPGTVHPDLVDLTAGSTVASDDDRLGSWALPAQDPSDTPGSAPTTVAGPGDVGSLTWVWGGPSAVAQVSVGGARSLDSTTTGVVVQLDEAGRWTTVASAPGGVGDGAGLTPYLLSRPGGVAASGVRVVLHGSGRLTVVDLHVLGSGPAA